MIPKQVAHSSHSLRFVMERLKILSKKNRLGKKIWNKMNRVKFRISGHQRVFINLLEKTEGATIQINNKFFFL